MNFVVKRTGQTWSIFQGSVLVEGGFFSLYAATRECQALNLAEKQYNNLR